MTMATERLASLEQVRAFVEGSEGLDFAVADRSSRNDFVRRMLVKFDYAALGKADKGLMKRFLGKATGLSRAQLTRLIGQRAKTGRIVDRRGGAPAKPFARRYTARDVVLLAQVDETLGQVCGQATRVVMRREFEVFGDARFERLAGVSTSHLYNLRKSRMKLPRFGGHLIIVQRRCPDGRKTCRLRAGVPAPDGGAGSGGSHARGAGSGVRVLGAGDPQLGASVGPRRGSPRRRSDERRAWGVASAAAGESPAS